jgi:hydrogenase maturation factor
VLSEAEVAEAQGYLKQPGISVVRDAQTALAAGRVTAMHDPTEGGLAGALWELAEACGNGVEVNLDRVPIPALASRVCAVLGLDPLATIASGALLLTTPPEDAADIVGALARAGIACADIGQVSEGAVEVRAAGPSGLEILRRPARDEIARLFAQDGS